MMEKHKYRIENDYEGEWHKLFRNGILIYEGHSIPDFIWVEELRHLGHEVEEEEVCFEE